MAQLLFGRGIKEISPFQAAQLASSIATLTGRGGDGILGSLRRSFGLDDIDVGTSESGDTELTLGTYLTDNVYTDVVVSDGRTELDINLELTPSITVTGSTADDGDFEHRHPVRARLLTDRGAAGLIHWNRTPPMLCWAQARRRGGWIGAQPWRTMSCHTFTMRSVTRPRRTRR